MPTTLPFGPWLPDQAQFENPGTSTALNVLPRTPKSYGPAPSLSTVTGALDDRCQGAMYVRDNATNVHGFAGDVSKLYTVVAGSTAWVDVSKVGGYTTNNEERWVFAMFGERVIATNFADPIQSYIMNSSALFADLAAAAPKARYIARVKDFIMVANTEDPIDGAVPQRVWWPAIDDPTNWPTPGSDTAASLQSDLQDLVGEGGWNMGIVGGLSAADAVIFQERCLWRAQYIGPPAVFSFAVLANALGTPAPGSIVQVGEHAYYLADTGFYMTDGLATVPIGDQQVDKTFWSLVDPTYLFRVTAGVDPVNKLIYWAFAGPQNVDGTPNYIIAYNWSLKQWSLLQQDTEVIFRALSTGYTLDQLDPFGDLETLPFSLDSRAWTGGRLNLAAFLTDHTAGIFGGPPLAATIDTSEANLNPRGLTHIDRVFPVVDTAQATITIGQRNIPSAAVSWGTPAAMLTTTGSCPVRSTARYQRARLSIPAGATWTHAQGIMAPDARAAGKR
jgi:hypothetical protein